MAQVSITRRRLGGSWGRIGAVLIGLVGLMFLFNMPMPWALIPSVVPIATAIVMGFGTERIELDLSTKRYRTGFSFFGIGGGAYKPLPALDHILIRDFHELVRTRYGGLHRSDIDKFELSLVAVDKSKLVICWTEDKKEALEHAQALRRLSKLPIVYTTRA